MMTNVEFEFASKTLIESAKNMIRDVVLQAVKDFEDEQKKDSSESAKESA